MKKCPFCAEDIQDEAVKCRFCKEAVPSTETQALRRGIKPCPRCGKKQYKYGFSYVGLFAETAMVLPTLIAKGIGSKAKDTDSNVIGKIVPMTGSGLGVFSAPFDFYRKIFKGIKSNPILVCGHCKRYVIMCPACNDFLMLERYPLTGEMIDCPKCKIRFGPSERSNDFDNFLKEQEEEG